MDLRSYTKQELALLYFPRCYSSSSQCSPDAMDPAHPRPSPKLAATGYGKNCKEFTPMQVSYILYFLGEP